MAEDEVGRSLAVQLPEDEGNPFAWREDSAPRKGLLGWLLRRWGG
ncbi:hypothetical protein ACEZCY_14080 [Streptacidiphilus sp. N1-12]|uniref:Uncharacterized protein n=2 Tax=Streptacidiphilus alkalitolerans TaxID=3342712 RepID=A0ABV6WE94_9ACTN